MTTPVRVDGVFLVDKPAGPTSAGTLEDFKRLLATALKVKKRDLPKVGHGGTLDPFATGLLVVFVGRATKLASYFLRGNKTYLAQVQLGAATESGDFTHAVVKTRPVPTPLTEDDLQVAANSFVQSLSGVPYLQTPPMYSAKKVEGRPLHELARQGQTIERKPVPITLTHCQVRAWDPHLAQATLQVECSGGTYIRVLAEDWAERLGTCAHLSALRRTRSGSLGVEQALTLPQWAEALSSLQSQPSKAFISMEDLWAGRPQLAISASLAASLFQGQKSAENELLLLVGKALPSNGPIAVMGPAPQGHVAFGSERTLLAVVDGEKISRI